MIGTQLGCWIIDKELGRGGMGRVYLAHRNPTSPAHPSGAEQAAVKVLSDMLANDTGFVHRFQREIDALSLLDHPNIVHFYESGSQDTRYFYAMEYVPGRNFDEILQEQKRLPWKDVLGMALQICPAIKHAHDHGIIHRDIKPQNLIRTADGVVKLADFGVAKVFASRQLTATGGLVGTAEYISPEQAAGKPVTIRSDLYSFGIVLYTLLTGRLPFQGETILDLLHQHRFGQFDAPKKYVPEMPYELDELICKLLEKDPADRPANALLLMRQLESLQNKMQRKESHTLATARVDSTRTDNAGAALDEAGPGPATLMSQLMREELAAQNRGNALGRLLGHPLVLIAILLACVGVVAWRVWPLDAASLYQRGAQMMESKDLSDWEQAEHDYFTPLDQRFPEHPYQEEVQAFRHRVEEARAEQQALAGTHPTASEAKRLYQRGQRQSKDGDLVGAARTFRDVIAVFDGVASEHLWVRRAQAALGEIETKLPPDEQRWATVRAALQRSKKLKREEAEKVWKGIEDLYRNDPSAKAILQEVQACRAEKR